MQAQRTSNIILNHILRYMILKLSQEYGTAILVLLEAFAVQVGLPESLSVRSIDSATGT